MIANTPAMDIKPGSMGKPLPGVEALHRAAARGRRRAGRRRRPTSRASWRCARAGRRCSAATSDQEERYRKCFAGELVPHRRPGAARRRRLLLVRRPRRRRDQVGRPPDRPVRGRERADGAPGGGRGRRHRQARPGGRRGGEGLRLAQGRASSRARTLRLELLGHARKRLGAAVAPKEIAFLPALPRTRSGKIMRRLLKARELGPARRRHLDAGGRRMNDDRATPSGPVPYATRLRAGAAAPTCCASAASRRSAPSSTAQAEDPRLPAPVHRRGGGGRRRDARARSREDNVVATYREHGHALLRGVPHERDHGRDVRQAARAARAAAAARCTCSTRATRFYGGNAIVGGGLPLAVGLALADKMQDEARVTACFFGEARWPRARSTNR